MPKLGTIQGTIDDWIKAHGRTAEAVRAELVVWLKKTPETVAPGNEGDAIDALIEMALYLARAYPEQREEWAEMLYQAADHVATYDPGA